MDCGRIVAFVGTAYLEWREVERVNDFGRAGDQGDNSHPFTLGQVPRNCQVTNIGRARAAIGQRGKVSRSWLGGNQVGDPIEVTKVGEVIGDSLAEQPLLLELSLISRLYGMQALFQSAKPLQALVYVGERALLPAKITRSERADVQIRNWRAGMK